MDRPDFVCPCGAKIQFIQGHKNIKRHFKATKHFIWEYREQRILDIKELLTKILPPENIK